MYYLYKPYIFITTYKWTPYQKAMYYDVLTKKDDTETLYGLWKVHDEGFKVVVAHRRAVFSSCFVGVDGVYRIT